MVASLAVTPSGYDPAEYQAQIARLTQAARAKSFDANGELTKQLDQYGDTGPQYSPESMAYFNSVNDYLNNNGTGYNLSPTHVNVADPRSGPAPLTDAQAQGYAAQPLDNQFVANFGYTGSDPTNWGAGNLQFAPDGQYRIVDRATGKVLYTGSGYDAGNQISKLASGLTDSAGTKANWSIQKADPSGQNWTQQYEHTPEDNGFGTFLKLALPLALGPLGGLADAAGLGTALGTSALATGAIGAGLGSALGGVANGDSIGDILKSAALSGGLAYGGGSLGHALSGGSAAGSTGSTLSNIAEGAGTVGADGITVLAPSLLQAAGTGLGVAAGSSLAVNPGSNVAPADEGDIVVNALKAPLPTGAGGGAFGASTASSLAALPSLTPEQIAQGQQQATDAQNDGIEVKGVKPLTSPEAAGSVAGAISPLAVSTGSAPETVDNRTIEVEGANQKPNIPLSVFPDTISNIPAPTVADPVLPKPTPLPEQPPEKVSNFDINDLAPTLAVLPAAMGGTPLPSEPTPPDTISNNVLKDAPLLAALPPALGQQPLPDATSTTPTTTPSTLDKITKILEAAGLGTGLLGSLLGGNGGGTLPAGAGTGSLSPVFHSTLPTTNLPGIGDPAKFTPRTMPQQDWNRYAMRPEQSFFNNVPSSYTPPLPGVKDPVWDHKAKGGLVEAPDYDYAGAKKAGVKPDERGHLPDTYKLPNHMTFSDDSVYSTPQAPGGKWRQSSDGKWVFWPSEFNMQQHPMGEMQDYFSRVEPDSPAIYPSDFRLKKAKGGSTRSGLAVKGRPTPSGRSDTIPAMLSDGEYVMDAETVALLGDGSNKAGANKLDQFRVNLRKHKGKQLAKGKFSLSAKNPEAYMENTNGRR